MLSYTFIDHVYEVKSVQVISNTLNTFEVVSIQTEKGAL